MRIAVFTDADFDRASDVDHRTRRAAAARAADVRPRVYTLSDLEVDEADYLALWSPAMPLALGVRTPRTCHGSSSCSDG